MLSRTEQRALLLCSGGILAASVLAAAVYVWLNPVPPSARKRRRQRVPGSQPAGLRNLGATCFANALVQALASSGSFVRWLSRLPLEQYDDTRQCASSEDKVHQNLSDPDVSSAAANVSSTPFLDELRRVIQYLNTSWNNDEDVDSAARLIEALHSHRWRVGTDVQQDLLELLNVFITTWDEELLAVNNNNHLCNDGLWITRSPPQNSNINHPSSSRRCSHDSDFEVVYNDESANIGSGGDGDCWTAKQRLQAARAHSSSQLRQCTLQRAACSAYVCTQLQCRRCGCKRLRYDTQCNVSLSLPHGVRDSDSVHLHSLLRAYFGLELLNDVHCATCSARARHHTNTHMVKRLTWAKLPSQLIININRVVYDPTGYGGAAKRDTHVHFPAVLNVTEFVMNARKDGLVSPSSSLLTTPLASLLRGGLDNAVAIDHRSSSTVVDNQQPSTSHSNSSVTSPQSGSHHSQQAQLDLDVTNESCSPMTHSKVLPGLPAAPPSRSYEYQLTAVVMHSGQASNSGHFVTYRKFAANDSDVPKWYYCSDTTVTQVPYEQVERAQAYMLFYERS